MTPLIVEVAINGGTPKSRNPHVPKTAVKVAEEAIALIEAGAAIIHTHTDRFELTGANAAALYMEAYTPVLARHPGAILYGTIGPEGGFDNRFGHYALLAQQGIRMGTFDPGPVNLGDQADGGLPRRSMLYGNSYEEIARMVELHSSAGLGPSIAIYEPGWLRTVLAYERAGKLPAGAMVKLYFGGRYNIFDGKRGDISFGLPPTLTALAAYLEMLEGSSLPWAVSTFGDCVVSTGLAEEAIRRGGHVRVGLEDYGGERCPSNGELLAEVVAVASRVGRPLATPEEAARILKLPEPARATA